MCILHDLLFCENPKSCLQLYLLCGMSCGVKAKIFRIQHKIRVNVDGLIFFVFAHLDLLLIVLIVALISLFSDFILMSVAFIILLIGQLFKDFIFPIASFIFSSDILIAEKIV